MINILYEPFPNSINADGKEFRILTDFREWLRFAEMLADKTITPEEKASLCGMWTDPESENVTAGMINSMIGFLRGDALEPDPPDQEDDEASDEPEPPKPPVLDFSIDARFILGDFRRFYNIDLLRVEYLHWWEFLSLLRALPDDSMTMRRIGYRSTDLNEIPDKRQRARIAKIQRQIALPFEYDDEMIGAMMWNA